MPRRKRRPAPEPAACVNPFFHARADSHARVSCGSCPACLAAGRGYGHNHEKAMPRTEAQIREAIKRLEHGNHSDADMRTVGTVLRAVFDDGARDPDPADLIRASAEAIKSTLEHFIAWLDGDDNPLFRGIK